MRTIIAGSRTTPAARVREAMQSCPWKPTVVLSGCARGADEAGQTWAKNNGVPVEQYPAEWDKYGRFAGHMRNGVMAGKADALVLVWDGKSPASRSMKKHAVRFGLRIHEVVV